MTDIITRRKMLSLAAIAPFTGALLGAAMAGGENTSSADPSRQPLPRASLTPRETIQRRYLPNVTLTDQHGRKVKFYDDLVKNKIVTINFFYAHCTGICPGETANLAKVQQMFKHAGREVFMNSISLKPKQDDPAALKVYAEMHGAGPGWSFLTGEPEDIELLRRSLGFTDPNPKLDKDTSNHIGNVRYGNEPLMLWAACAGLTNPKYIYESVSWMFRPNHPAAAVEPAHPAAAASVGGDTAAAVVASTTEVGG